MVATMKTLLGGVANDTEILILSHTDSVNPNSRLSVTRRGLNGGLRCGMEIIEVDNGRLKFWLLPERGMGIWKVWLDGIEIGWKSPIRGPVHPQFVPIHEESGLGWLAGFDELLCRCGLESNGEPEFDDKGKLVYPLHGKIANLPAHKVEMIYEDETSNIRVEGWVDESRFKSQGLGLRTLVTTKAGSSEICIHDRVTNLSDTLSEFQLLYHINFGVPLLGTGAEVVVPVKTLVPRTHRAEAGVSHWQTFMNPETGFMEQVYFMELLGDSEDRSQVLLRNADRTLGVSIHFNLKQLPCFTLWKNAASLMDGYVAGLEPGTNFPNPRSYEKAHGRVEILNPGESREFDLYIKFHMDKESIEQAEQSIAEYQAKLQPRIFQTMQPGWSIEATTSKLMVGV